MNGSKAGNEVELTAVICEEEGGFVSLCPELGVASCGDSVEDAASMLQEAVELYLENVRELGLDDEGLLAKARGSRWTTSFRVAV